MSEEIKNIEICKGEEIGNSILEETENIELYINDLASNIQNVILFANEI